MPFVNYPYDYTRWEFLANLLIPLPPSNFFLPDQGKSLPTLHKAKTNPPLRVDDFLEPCNERIKLGVGKY
jgi:hypothetical protein